MATIRFEGVRKTYPNGHVAARVWPPAMALVGLLLVLYREG